MPRKKISTSQKISKLADIPISLSVAASLLISFCLLILAFFVKIANPTFPI